MYSVVISGASGAIGQKFTDYLLSSAYPALRIILLSSSNAGFARLKSRYDHIEKMEVVSSLTDCRDMLLGHKLFINFSFVSQGLPWERIRKNRSLAKAYSSFAIANKFDNFVEVSSQSVFGFALADDVDCDASPSLFAEEYGLTKLAAEEEIQRRLSHSSCHYSIVRLGNVLFEESGPFSQRLIEMLFYPEIVQQIRSNAGFLNATLLENTIPALAYVLYNRESYASGSIFHFSEASHLRWDLILEVLMRTLDGYEFCAGSSVERQQGFSLVRILRSRGLGPLYNLISYLPTQKMDTSLTRLYRNSRTSSQGNVQVFDESALLAYQERHRFFPNFPMGFRYEVPLCELETRLEEMYQKLAYKCLSYT